MLAVAQNVDGATRLSPSVRAEVAAAIARLAGMLDPTVIATRAAQEASVLARMDLVGIALVEGQNTVVMKGAVGGASDWFPNMRLQIDPGHGFAGTILSTGRPLRLNTRFAEQGIHALDPIDGEPGDVVLDEAYASHLRERVAPESVREYIGIPIAIEGNVLGVLYAGNRRRESCADSRTILLQFASFLAPVLDTAVRARRAAVAELTRERERIAFGLHDTIGQILFGIGVGAQRARRLLDEEPVAAKLQLDFIEQEASRAGAHLRGILASLAEPAQELDLEKEARILASMLAARSSICTDVVVSGTPRTLAAEICSVLTSVVGEGLHNVEKHGNARCAIVSLHYGVSEVCVTVQDDGQGLRDRAVLDRPSADGSGRGLWSLRKRVERLGGQLGVRALDGGGTVLRASI